MVCIFSTVVYCSVVSTTSILKHDKTWEEYYISENYQISYIVNDVITKKLSGNIIQTKNNFIIKSYQLPKRIETFDVKKNEDDQLTVFSTKNGKTITVDTFISNLQMKKVGDLNITSTIRVTFDKKTTWNEAEEFLKRLYKCGVVSIVVNDKIYTINDNPYSLSIKFIDKI